MPSSTGSGTVRDACSDAPADFRPVDCELISIAGKAVSRGQARSSGRKNLVELNASSSRGASSTWRVRKSYPTADNRINVALGIFKTGDGSHSVSATVASGVSRQYSGRRENHSQADASRTARQVPVWTLSTEFQGRTHVAAVVVDAVHGPLVPGLRDRARSRPTRMRSGSRTSKTLSRSKRRENPPVPMTMARSPWNAWS
jgi:hypothetical protein